MVKIKSEKITPVCPFCENEIDNLVEVKNDHFLSLEINRVFCCPICRKILGLSAGAL